MSFHRVNRQTKILQFLKFSSSEKVLNFEWRYGDPITDGFITDFPLFCFTMDFPFFYREKNSFLPKKYVNFKIEAKKQKVFQPQKIIDFADLSSDELIGGFDEIKGKKIRIDGYLEEFSLSRKEADELIMSAREIAYK